MMTTEEFKRNILRLQPRLQRTAEGIVGDRDSAADAVQEAVITLWEQRVTISEPDMERLSLTIVKRRSIDVLRRQKPTVNIDTEQLMLLEVPAEAPSNLLPEYKPGVSTDKFRSIGIELKL